MNTRAQKPTLKNRLSGWVGLAIPMLLLAACGGGGGGGSTGGTTPVVTPAVSTAASIEPLPVGSSACPQGGVTVKTGIDENGNGLLDDDEVDATQDICHGVSTRVAINDEPVGPNCPYGGLRIDSGTDTNGNDVLDSGEILATDYLCQQGDVRIGWGPKLSFGDNIANPLFTKIDTNAVLMSFTELNSSSQIINNRIYVPDTGWSYGYFLYPTNFGSRSYRASVTADGTVVYAFLRNTDPTIPEATDLMSATLSPGSTGWNYQPLNDAPMGLTEDHNSSFDVVVNANGHGIAAWVERDRILKVLARASGVGWGATPVELYNASAAIPPTLLYGVRVLMSADNRGTAIWLELSESIRPGGVLDARLWASRYDPNASPAWSPPELVGGPFEILGVIESTPTFPSYMDGYLRMDVEQEANGNVHVGWIYTDMAAGGNKSYQISLFKYDAGTGAWGSEDRVPFPDVYGPSALPFFDLAINNRGDRAVVYGVYKDLSVTLAGKGQSLDCIYQQRLSGDTWSSPEVVLPNVGGLRCDKLVWLGNTGSVMLIGRIDNGVYRRFNVIAARRDPGVGWTTPVELGEAAFQRSIGQEEMKISSVMADDAGNVLVAWQERRVELLGTGPAELFSIAVRRYRIQP